MSTLTVAAIRFTDGIPPMKGFLETLGLSTAIEGERGGWVDLRAGAGRVWLHSAADSDIGANQGQTGLSLESSDVAALTERLVAAGHQAAYVDESYGRSMTVVDPLGDTFLVNEHSDDTYGFVASTPAPDSRLIVSPVRFTDPQGPYAAFLLDLGLQLKGSADEWYAGYDSGDGLVGLHHDDGEAPIVPGPGAAVHLTFGTTEDLDALASRLREAGYGDAQVQRDEFVSYVEVTDPDGQPVQIHASKPVE
ncbi:VOC family protein [Luteipulveratus mongoliensis]|uniref:VOC family protein n=1 Tax=Luteipulveratus mongoliensis TaxID=571913 RepID=UPI000698B4F1|nr:VOC family protein [Luteipulveratus mongoliensis]